MGIYAKIVSHMMTSLRNTARLCGYFAIACLMASSTYAAVIDASPRQGYGRINFAFPDPAKLKTSVSGTTAVLSFNAPITQSPEAITSSLPDYVTAAKLSVDKRSVILTLREPYRLRQFVSGNTVGVDLVAITEPPKPAPEDTATRASLAPAATNAELPAASATSDEPAPGKQQPEADAILSTKKPQVTSNPAPSAPEKKVDPAANTPDIMSTKPATAPAKPTEEAAAPATAPTPSSDALLSTKSAPVPEAAKPPPAPLSPAAPETTTEPTSAEAAPVAEEETRPTPNKNAPFLVTVRSVNAETVINFPWGERTGAAVFKRDNTIWIVFSRAKSVNAGLLRTVLPKSVLNVTQYAYQGNTVVKLTTDGSLNVRAQQVKGGYGWNVILGAQSAAPTLDVSVTTDSLEGSMRLVLGVFDIAPELRFYDPDAGDAMIIIPTFEDGRGISVARRFPEVDMLASTQGIAIVSRRDDITTGQTRSGLIISAEDGLAISENLPTASGTALPATGLQITGVMIPYEQWVVPHEKFLDTLASRWQIVAASTPATKAASLMEIVKLYFTNGMEAEAGGILRLIKSDFPDYYTTNKLALLSAASNIMLNHIDTATADLASPELMNSEEAMLWRQVVAVFARPAGPAQLIQQSIMEQMGPPAPTTSPSTNDSAGSKPVPVSAMMPQAMPKPIFQFLKYNKSHIRFYPPRIRQRLATIAADAYIADEQQEKALAVFDTLTRDGIIAPVMLEGEFALGTVAEKKGEIAQALEIFGRLATQSANPQVAARARYALTMLQLAKDKITPDVGTEELELIRMGWRGDALERKILADLIGVYSKDGRYDDVLRTRKAIQDAFPDDPEGVLNSAEMAELFERLYTTDLGKDMQPLKALSLFYEFRELTPLGERGDLIVQGLANRLAAIDLLDRATQLLEHQIKFRATGESRSRIGARLALLHLLNQRPQEALSVLEVTNFGQNPNDLHIQRQQLTSLALTKLGKNEEALGVIYNDITPTGALLRLDVLWAMKDWPNIINRAEDILSTRPNLTDPLANEETEVLLKLALAYTFESDYVQLRYLRDYYSNLIPDSAYKQIFEFITNDTTPLDPADFEMVAKQISNTESFLDMFKKKIAAGKLSEAIQ